MTNKRFLILAPYFFPYQNPRARRVLKLLEQMDKSGLKVDVVCSLRSEKPTYLSENIKIHPCGFNSIKEKFSSLSGIPSKKNNSSNISSRLKSIVRNLNTLFLKSLYWPDDSFVWKKRGSSKTHQLFKKYKYDAIICFSFPYTSLLIGETIKKSYPDTVWINDIGDPLAFQHKSLFNNNWLYEKKNHRTEQRILNGADLNIITNESLKRIYERKLNIQSKKLRVVGPFNQVAYPITKKKVNKPVSFLYLGTFYSELRSPLRLMILFKEILNQVQNKDIHFFIAGPLRSEEIKIFQSDPTINDCLTIYPFLDKKETQTLIEKSSFLVNISNLSEHQLPSKCADYIASCLPIINVYELEQDVSKSYLKKHPLVYNYNSSLSSEDQKHSLRSFIEKNENKSIPEKLSSEILKESSPEYMFECIRNLWRR